MRDREADPQPGQAVGLGEGAQHADVRAVPVQVEAVGHLGVADELDVRLVDDDQHLGRDGVQEALQLGAVDHVAGGVVGVADEDQPGPLGDRGQHRVQVVVAAGGERHRDRGRAGDLGDDRVGLEGAPGEHHLVARARRGEDQRLGDADRAGAGGDVLDRHVEVLRQFGGQLGDGHVRVAVELAGRGDRRLQHPRERLVGVLVGRQLVGVGACRLAGLVGGNAVQARPEAGALCCGHGRSPSVFPLRSPATVGFAAVPGQPERVRFHPGRVP